MRAVLLLLALLIAQSAIAADDVHKRLDALERRIEKLERSKAQVKTTATKDRAVWRSLKVGMTKDEIRDVLGEPGRIAAGEVLIFWYWNYPNGGSVTFDERTGRATNISEP